MVKELVVDTNIFLHAERVDEPRRESSLELLNRLLSHAIALCLDGSFPFPDPNCPSQIGQEYITHLQHGSIGYAIVAELAKQGLIRTYTKTSCKHATRKKIEQLVRKKRDRVFVIVAALSANQMLVSHDFEDFQASKRRAIRNETGVAIVEACECPLLTA